MFDPLRHPRSELNAAARAIDAMSKASTVEVVEQAWREFLSCLEKLWVKTERVCQPQRARFQPWQGRYQALRKKDALLRYLKQARNADNHSIQDLSQLHPSKMTVKLKGPRGANGEFLNDLEITEKEVNNYNHENLFIEITSPHLEVLPVKNDGKWYNPPASHLNKPVEDIHPVTLAVLGFEFYSKFLDNVEDEFFADQ